MDPGISKSSRDLNQQWQFNPDASGESKAQSLDLVRSLRMHWVLATCVAAAALAFLVFYALTRRPYYETEALIYVQPIKARLTDATGGSYDSMRYDTYIQQQLQTIVRPDILSEALSKLGPDIWSLPGEPDQSAIARLQHSLKVERDLGSYQVSVSLSGNDPIAITKVVNAVVEAYIHKERVDELAQSDQQLLVLKDERDRIQSELEKNRQEQAQLSSNLGVADTAGDTGNPYDVQLTELRTQLATARAEHAVAEARLASVSNSGSEPSAALKAAADDTIAADTGLAAIKSSIDQRRAALASQMAGLTPKNPLYKQDEDELARLDNMSTELHRKAAQQLQDKLRLDATRTADVESRLANQLMQQTAIATGATPKLQRAADLTTEIQRLQGRYTEVYNAISTIELEHNTSGLVHLSLAAVPPLKPKPSKKVLILVLALPLALACGAIAAVVVHRLDQKVYIGEDVGGVLGFQPMAVLPNPDDVDSKVVDECLLRLVAGLDQAHRTGGTRTFVFTATSPTTNITELVAPLAAKMDSLGYRTMVLKASAALQNLAVAEPQEEMSKPWGETRMMTKPSETRLTPVRRESLVVENLERLKQNVDLLFIEAFPLLSSAEAEFAARLADVTVLIAESSLTTRKELATSLALVRRLNVSGIAAVLSNVSLRNATEEFRLVIRGVEGRQSEVRYRDARSAQRAQGKAPFSTYEDPDLVSHEQETKP